MQTRVTDRPVEQVIAAIQALDLGPIKFKLMDREEGHGWSREYADRMETEYKRFLTLLAAHPDQTLAPSKDVDRFWHGHILDTLKYAEDCDKVFGCFLHHFPYFGMRGAEDAANLARAAETTQSLYVRQFGSSAAIDAGRPAYCSAIQASGGPAFCAAIEASRPAYCSAIEASSPAYCSAIEASRPAYCSAIQASSPAYCSAIQASSPAYCSAIQASGPAYCSAIQASGPAYCSAIQASGSAYCSAVTRDKLNVSLRPSL
jgi:hypothetical protein